MKQHSVMIKPASSLCNMRCSYCFYHDVAANREIPSYGIMSKEICKAVIENIFSSLEEGDSVTIAFQGGEPTLAGLGFFEYFVNTVKEQNKNNSVSYALQTNGLILDEDWCCFLRNNHFLIGLSIDGFRSHHNTYRIDPNEKGTYDRVLAAKKLLDQTEVQYNILSTLTNALARHPQKFFRFLLQEDIQYVQLTPCLSDLGTQGYEWGLTPQRFYRFYKDLYVLWKRQVIRGRYISIKLFDDIVNLYVRREITACGIHGSCCLHFIVEANGDTYPCDFYVLDQYNGGSLCSQSLKTTQQNLDATGFLKDRVSLPPLCGNCAYRNVCNGGCKRMFNAMYVDEKNQFCGFRQLLNDIGQDLCETGAMLIRQSQRNQ